MQIRENPDVLIPPYEVPVTECLICGAQYSDIQTAYHEAKIFLAAKIPEGAELHQRLVDRFESGEIFNRICSRKNRE